MLTRKHNNNTLKNNIITDALREWSKNYILRRLQYRNYFFQRVKVFFYLILNNLRLK